MLSFRLFGFPVQVQWIFWILCLFLGMRYLQEPGPDGITKFAIMTVIVFCSIIWHELGHAWARKKSGAPYSEITLHGFGGYCSGPGHFTRGESIFISAAGPLASLLLGGLTFVLALAAGTQSPWVGFAVGWLLWANIGWAILNLLPIYPLDGGQIFAGIAGPRHYRTVLWIGLVLAIGLGLAGFVFLGSLFAAILFGLLAWGNWQRLQGQQSSFL